MTSICVLFPTRHLTGEAFLCERAIRSLFDQTNTDWHLIVVEYGGNARTHAAYAATQSRVLDGRVTWVYHPHLQHTGAAFQFALGHADPDTELVTFLHEEFEWDPHFLDRTWQAWAARQQIGMVYCDEQEYGLSGQPVQWTPRIDDFDRRRLMDGSWAHLPAIATSYQCLTQLGGFDFVEAGVLEWDMALRLSRFGVCHLPEPLVKHYWSVDENPELARQQYFRSQIEFRIKSQVYGPEGSLTYDRWLAPESPQMRLNDARARLLAGRDREGLEQLSAVVNDFPNFAPALLVLGDYSRAAGGLDRARELYRRATELDPSGPATARLMELDSQSQLVSPDSGLAPLVECLGHAVTQAEADRAAHQLRRILDSTDAVASISAMRDELDETFLALVELNARQAYHDGEAELAEGLSNLFAYVTGMAQPVESL